MYASGHLSRFEFPDQTTRLAAQSSDFAYNVIAIASDGEGLAIAGEVKKARAEIDELFKLMVQFGANPRAPRPTTGKARNVCKKVLSLPNPRLLRSRRNRPRLAVMNESCA